MSDRINVRMPDGTIIRNVPRGTTKAEIEKRYSQAKAKPKGTGEQLWDATKNVAAGAVFEGLGAIPDAVTEASAGAMRMIASPAAKLAAYGLRAVGAPQAAQSVERNARTFDQGLSRPMTFRRMGEAAVPVPQDTAGQIARVGGSLIGGSAYPNKLLPRAVQPKAPVPTFPGSTAPSKARRVIEAGKRENVPVMTTDVRPPTSFLGKSAQATGERIPFAGTGGPRAAQAESRVAAATNLAAEYGADDLTRPLVNDVAGDLAATRSGRLSALTNSKNAVIDKFDTPVPLENTTRAIDAEIGKLRALKSEQYGPAIAKLEDWKQALQNQPLRNVEELRKGIGEAFKAPELSGVRSVAEKSLSRIYAPLREEMGGFIQRNGDAGDFTQWKAANDELSSMAGELTGTFKGVLRDADTTPENVRKLLFSNKPSDVSRLYSNLSEQGQQAARGALLQEALAKANRNGEISADIFTNEVQRLSKNIGAVFSPEESGRITKFVELMQATKRGAQAGAHPPTGAQNWPAIAAAVLTDVMGGAGAALGTGGLMGLSARAYESAPVRDYLTREAITRAPGLLNVYGPGAAAPLSNVAANDIGGLLGGRTVASLAAEDRQREEENRKRGLLYAPIGY